MKNFESKKLLFYVLFYLCLLPTISLAQQVPAGYWDPKTIDLFDDDISIIGAFRGTTYGNVKVKNNFNRDPDKFTTAYGWSSATTGNRITFSVNAPTTGDYHVTLLIRNDGITSGNTFTITANGTQSFAIPEKGIGQNNNQFTSKIMNDVPIRLNAGSNNIHISLSQISSSQATNAAMSTATNPMGSLELLGIEVVEENLYDNLLVEERRLQSDLSWYKRPGTWGLMVHFSPLRTRTYRDGYLLTAEGYSAIGQSVPNGYTPVWEDYVNNFDVQAFCDKVDEFGASYVIFTIMHGLAYLPAPSNVLDGVISGRTTQRDLIGELANELDARGKRLHLYYHANVTTQGPDFDYKNGAGFYNPDPQVFNNHLIDLHRELSLRYGNKLWGTATYFDTPLQGLFQHEFPWKKFAEASKAGNPNAIVGLSNQKVNVISMFSDIDCVDQASNLYQFDNEFFQGINPYYGVTPGTSYTMENRWYYDNTTGSGWETRSPRFSAQQYANYILDNNNSGTFQQMNIMITGEVDDNTPFFSPATERVLLDMKAILDAETGQGSDTGMLINDNDDRITKIGNWLYSDNRNSGDYQGDLSYTATNGNYIDFSFTGTSVQLIGPSSPLNGAIEVRLDGVLQGNFTSTISSTYTPQQIYYSATNLSSGVHTLRVIKRGGKNLQIDAINVGYENLALGRPSLQSSTFSNAVASRANDGNTNGKFSGNSVAHTNSSDTSVQDYWEVDLGIASSIEAIKVWNRTDNCCAGRLSNFNIFISETPFTTNKVFGLRADDTIEEYRFTGTAGSPTVITTEGATGRYVRLQLNSQTDPINLAELEVFGTRFGNNLSRNKQASQSSTAFGGVASRANDNNIDGNFNNESVSHTALENNVQDWWQVDLGADAIIEDIRIWNRSDAGELRLSNFNIFISKVPFTSNSVNATANQTGVTRFTFGGQAERFTDIDTEGTVGRYVRLQLNDFSDPIHMAELKVFGQFLNGGTTNLLSTKTVESKTALDNNGLILYPNPASGTVNLQIQSSSIHTETLQILSLLNGQIVKDYNLQLIEGTNQIKLDITGIPTGIYYIRDTNNNGGKLIVN